MTWETLAGFMVAVITFGMSLAAPTEDAASPPGAATSTSFSPQTPAAKAEMEGVMRLAGKCWSKPAPGVGSVPVRLLAEFDDAGRVISAKVLVPQGPDLDGGSIASVDAAEAALRDCQPYNLSPARLGGRRTLVLDFDAESNPKPTNAVKVVPLRDPSPPEYPRRFSITPREETNRFLPAPR